jgi:hypothetical protein
MGDRDPDSLDKTSQRCKYVHKHAVERLPMRRVLDGLNSAEILQPFAESCD